jgi:hypothetical protein
VHHLTEVFTSGLSLSGEMSVNQKLLAGLITVYLHGSVISRFHVVSAGTMVARSVVYT